MTKQKRLYEEGERVSERTERAEYRKKWKFRIGQDAKAGGNVEVVVKDLRELKESGVKVAVEVAYVDSHMYSQPGNSAPNWSCDYWIGSEELYGEDLKRPAVYVLGDRFGNCIAFHVPAGEYRLDVRAKLAQPSRYRSRDCYRLGNVVVEKDGSPRAVGRTGFVLTVSKIMGDGPVVVPIPEFEDHPPYTCTLYVFNSSGEERVVRVGDNAIIFKREMFCTAEVEERSEEWTRMQASGRLCCRFQPVEVVYYYERRPEDTGVLHCQPGQKLEFHNGWWEDGKLIVEDRFSDLGVYPMYYNVVEEENDAEELQGPSGSDE
eukprot:jgi/Botrbrau1/11841/Bobra.0175s0006.2